MTWRAREKRTGGRTNGKKKKHTVEEPKKKNENKTRCYILEGT